MVKFIKIAILGVIAKTPVVGNLIFTSYKLAIKGFEKIN